MMRRSAGPDPVLLLGAGASVKSGVPLAGDMVSMAAIWGYCQEHGRTFDDPTITRSDWWPWLSNQSWFKPEEQLSDQYPRAVERLLGTREDRREFFFRMLSRAQGPSAGYAALARLVAADAVQHILTVNFDDMAAQACNGNPQVLRIEVIEGPADLVKFSLAPTYPQLVYLHGSVDRYEDRNLEAETKELDGQMRDAVLPLLRDHPLVVLGYRGTEPSIMQDLLLRGADQVNAYRHGVFWCLRPGEDPSQHVLTLADRLKNNFSLVEIAGFDEAMDGWAGDIRPAPAPRINIAGSDPEPDVPDIRPERELTLGDLDRPGLMARLGEYAQHMDLSPLSSIEDDAVLARLRELRLARADTDATVLTRASALLFGTGDRTRIEIRAGDVFLPISGNVFRVLEQTLEALDELNEPFRLKANTSEDVRRFEPRAIKEAIVNALAHRDHDRTEPVRVTFSERSLTVTSPGGVVPTLRLDQLGERGVRAYRNPVIADLLYGCGAMDKRGSGLADIRRWTRQSGGEATFEPIADGSEFRVHLTTRDLDPDPVTGTADPGELEHFMTNVLPVSIADEVYLTRSTITSYREIYEAHRDEDVPPFALGSPGLVTFAPATGDDSPFTAQIAGDSTPHAVAELARTADGARLIVQLLNTAVYHWAHENGLRSDAGGRRLWFPRSDDGTTEITYRARVRDATRTVTKPNISRATEKVRYWEHEALRFSFRQLGDQWVMQLVPTIVFTTDGYDELLRGRKVGPLVTRRMARDFNPQVQNDLYFWRWVFARGEPVAQLNNSVQIDASFVSRDIVDAPAAPGGLHSDEVDDTYDEEITDELADLAFDRARDLGDEHDRDA